MKRDLTIALTGTPDRAYPVHLRRDARPELVERIGALAATGRVIIVSDATVAPLHAAPVAAALRDRGLTVTLLDFPAGEPHKTLATLTGLYDRALTAGLDRQTPVIALGGGVTGDLGGLLAATLLRGLPLVQVPTSVLAAVDSSVGGKTGVDTPHGKNLIGAFHQPRFVFCDLAHLATLPARETRAGLAEAVKHAVIADPELLDQITRDGARLAAGDLDALAPVIPRAIAIKAALVRDDEHDRGRRAVLNLGHTLGHALEAASDYTLRHGEAIALGLRFAARHSVLRAGLDPRAVDRIDAALDALELPADWAPRVDADVLARLASDKKINAHSIDAIVLGALGDARVMPLALDRYVADVHALAAAADPDTDAAVAAKER